MGVSWESLLPGLGSGVRVGSWGMGWGSVPVWGSGLVVSPALVRSGASALPTAWAASFLALTTRATAAEREEPSPLRSLIPVTGLSTWPPHEEDLHGQ